MLHCATERTWKAFPRIQKIGIIGLAPIRAPMTLVSAGLSIEDDDTMIQVSVGDIELVCLLIDDEAGWTAHIFRVVASTVFSTVADLHQEFAVASEFQNLVVLRSCSCEKGSTLKEGICRAFCAISVVADSSKAMPSRFILLIVDRECPAREVSFS